MQVIKVFCDLETTRFECTSRLKTSSVYHAIIKTIPLTHATRVGVPADTRTRGGTKVSASWRPGTPRFTKN
jgi:hypothetical protein